MRDEGTFPLVLEKCVSRFSVRILNPELFTLVPACTLLLLCLCWQIVHVSNMLACLHIANTRGRRLESNPSHVNSTFPLPTSTGFNFLPFKLFCRNRLSLCPGEVKSYRCSKLLTILLSFGRVSLDLLATQFVGLNLKSGRNEPENFACMPI